MGDRGRAEVAKVTQGDAGIALADLLPRVAVWAAATFREETVQSKLEHLLEEVQEILAAPGDIEEYADALMLLFDAARLAGFGLAELVSAMDAKFQVNQRREWRGFRHVKEAHA